MKNLKIHIFILLVALFGLWACQSSGPDEKSATTSVGSTSTGTGGTGTATPPSSGTQGVFQPSITGNSSPIAGVAETYTLTIAGQPIFPIRIVWDSFPTGILFNPNPQDIIQSTNQVTVQVIAPQAGTYDLIGTVLDSSQPSRQSTAQMQINVIASGGAGGITPGPTNVIISGNTGIFVNAKNSYVATVPSHFVGPLSITWSSDDIFIRDQLRTQINTLSVEVTPMSRSFTQLTYIFTLFVTVVDANSQTATGQMTVKVCTFSALGTCN